MGAWGTGVFDDDLACEVRETYRDVLAEGVSAEQARDMTLQYWAEIMEDDDAAVVIWLALAVSQWKAGRLDDLTRCRAIAVIETEAALRAWKDDPKGLRRRQSVLEKVRQQLLSPQPPPVRIRKRFRDTCDWQRGELIAYRMRSGTNVVLRVVGHHTDRGGTSPVFEVLDCAGQVVPPGR